MNDVHNYITYLTCKQIVTSLQMKSCNKPHLTNLLQLVEKMQQASKIDNLQQLRLWRFWLCKMTFAISFLFLATKYFVAGSE